MECGMLQAGKIHPIEDVEERQHGPRPQRRPDPCAGQARTRRSGSRSHQQKYIQRRQEPQRPPDVKRRSGQSGPSAHVRSSSKVVMRYPLRTKKIRTPYAPPLNPPGTKSAATKWLMAITALMARPAYAVAGPTCARPGPDAAAPLQARWRTTTPPVLRPASGQAVGNTSTVSRPSRSVPNMPHYTPRNTRQLSVPLLRLPLQCRFASSF